MSWQIILIVNILFFIIGVFMLFPPIGLYLIAFLYPFWGLEFVSGSLNIPYVDIAALLLFLSVLVKVFVHHFLSKRVKNPLQKFPHIFQFSLFFIACFIAITHNLDQLEAFKYLLRPILFFYLMYVLLPVNLIKTKKVFYRVLGVMIASGFLTAILGFLSVVFSEGSWFARRAVPFSIFGQNLLGGNHNAVAEIMIVTIPLLLLFHLLSKNYKTKNYLFVGLMFLLLVLMFTFSRSGWLSVLLQFAILFTATLNLTKQKINIKNKIIIITVLVIVLVMFYVLVWGQVAEVQGSTSSRYLMSSVAWHHFSNHSIIGNGLNSFSDLVGNTFIYWVEFGDPLDSHGVLQKIITETGLLGLLTFGFLFYKIFQKLILYYRRASHQTKKIILIFIIMITGALFFQLFSTSYYIAKLWFPIGVSLSALPLFSQKSKI